MRKFHIYVVRIRHRERPTARRWLVFSGELRMSYRVPASWLVGLLLLALAACSMSSDTAAPQGAAPAAQTGSLQGGYLGKDPGAAAASSRASAPTMSVA